MLAPMTLEDLLRFAIPTELALTPDGRHLAFTLQTQDATEDIRKSAIWLRDVHAPEQPARPFTNGQFRDRSPMWSPDGNWLAFISDREQGAQVWVMPSMGGEPRRVTRMRHGVSQPIWSPDSTALLFLAEVRADEDPILLTETTEAQTKQDAKRLRHITRLQYRWDGSDISEGRTHVWQVEVTAFLRQGLFAEWPTPQQITTGDFDHADPAGSPDGAQIAFVSDRAEDRDANRTDGVWALTLATNELVQLTTGPSENSRPSWSPDGRSIAWYGASVTPTTSHSNSHLWLATLDDVGNWQTRDVLAGQDVNIGHGINGDMGSLGTMPPQWRADGQAISVTACVRGTSNLHRITLRDGALTPITQGDYQCGPFITLPDDHTIVAIIATPDRPADIAQFSITAQPATLPEHWLTEANPWLSERALATPQHFTFAVPDGWELEGWVLWPAAATESQNEGKSWPAILQIHGGPHGNYGPNFFALMQIFASAGYAVVFVNPRGSIGYGETFARACDRDWGGADYHDIIAGLDAAIALGGIDPERLAVTGTSYGGYMTNWIIGHTERFKAAVTINSVSNLISSFGTSDVDATFGVVEQGGTPWNRLDFYLERSPVTYAPHITTPTRVIGAERDWRCPIEQSEQMFTAIKMLGRTETDFLRVPGVSHSINTGTPQQRVAQRRAILEWMQRFLPGGVGE